MLADPFATAVTSPLALTVATPAFDDVQVKVRLVFVFPFARRLAVSWTVSPRVTSVAVAGVMTTTQSGCSAFARGRNSHAERDHNPNVRLRQ